MLFEPDNTVQHAVAEGNVHIESRGPTVVDIYWSAWRPQHGCKQQRAAGDPHRRREVRHPRRQPDARLGRHLHPRLRRPEPARALPHGDQRAHACRTRIPASLESGQPAVSRWTSSPTRWTFSWRTGSDLKTADTIGKAQIVILPNREPRAPKSTTRTREDMGDSPQPSPQRESSMPSSARATRCSRCTALPIRASCRPRRATLTRSAPPTSWMSRSTPMAGVQKLIQTGNFEYHEPPAKPDTGGRSAFADKADLYSGETSCWCSPVRRE